MYFTTNNLKLVLLGATFAALTSINGVADAAVVNGSFEDPAIASNSWQGLAVDDPSLTGWTYESPLDGASMLINGHGVSNLSVLGPQDGNQFIEMSGGNTGHGPVHVEQTLAGLNIGAQYNVIGYYGWTHRPGDEFGHFKVTLVGTGDLLGPTTVNNDQAWTQFNLPFTATATSHTIRFSSVGTNFSQHVGLDNISVVPEPSAIVLAMGGGLLCVGRTLRRRIGLQ